MLKWVKNLFLKRKIARLSSISVNEQFLEDQLRDTAKDYTLTLREAEKMRKVIEARRRVNDLKQAVKDTHASLMDEMNDEEDEDEEDEDDFDDDNDEGKSDFDKQLEEIIMRPLLEASKAKLGGLNSPTAAALAPSSSSNLSDLQKKAIDIISNASDDDIKKYLR